MSKPGRADSTSANLTPASGRQDHTTSPYATTSFVSSPFDRSRAFRQPALPSRCAPNAAASTASHPASLTIRIRPSVGRDGESSRLIWVRWEQVFFGKSEKKTRQPCREAARRANHLIAARAHSSCPGRGAAPFALLRRAGTQSRPSRTMDPGSAAHHAASHSASKTRVNALMALRSIRRTS